MRGAMSTRYLIAGVVILLVVGLVFVLRSARTPSLPAGLPSDALAVANERGLSPEDVYAALATYVPGGKHDEYVMFASGGHSGQVIAIGIPSMRILKIIPVFVPDSWSGYGFGVENTAIHEVYGRGPYPPADTHHPAISETNGEYDGEFLFIGDKLNGRVAVVDLRDWETKQIVRNPVLNNNHGAAFVTPNTEYVVEVSQYGAPLGHKYAPLERYKEEYRGLITFWKFDRKKGRIIVEESFAIELPPYWQDLLDCGKGASDGWVFVNSFNTELATGGVEKGNPPFEAGVSQNDMDYLHIINWRKAEELVKAGKFTRINGFRVIPIKEAVAGGVLYLAPEPKSPHGVDVSPGGQYIVVGGKLDPHVTVYSIDRIKQAIEKKDYEKTDDYGIPVLRFDAVKEAQVELGLGPLHTQFDDKGYAYTSLFLDTAVVRWTLGPNDKYKAPEEPWKVVGKVQTHYNIGHLAVVEGDTTKPGGKYLVALNKWSVDRFLGTGPLLPQNLQLIDISGTGDTMRLLADMPLGMGEPHYAQIIRADRLKSWEVYPEVGWDPHRQAKSPHATDKGRIEVKGDTVHIYTTVIRSHFNPEHVKVKKGQKVVWHLTNTERTRDATHGFAIPAYGIGASIEPGETVTVQFTANKEGSFPFYCTEFCSALHLEMMGYLLVEP
jgi:nitrous-oxide reductase